MKTKGKDVIRTLPVTMKEEQGLKREVEGLENASCLKELLEVF